MAAEQHETEVSMTPNGENRTSNDSFISEALKTHLQGLIKKHDKRMALHIALRERKPGSKEKFDYAITDNLEGMAAVRWLIEAGCDFRGKEVAQELKVKVGNMLFGKKNYDDEETPVEIAFFSGRYTLANFICKQIRKCDQPQACSNQPLPPNDDSKDPTSFDVDAAFQNMLDVTAKIMREEKLLDDLTAGQKCELFEARNDENTHKEEVLEGVEEWCPSVNALNLLDMLQENGDDGEKSHSSAWCVLFPGSPNSSKRLLRHNTGIATEEGNAVEMNGNGRARSPSSNM